MVSSYSSRYVHQCKLLRLAVASPLPFFNTSLPVYFRNKPVANQGPAEKCEQLFAALGRFRSHLLQVTSPCEYQCWCLSWEEETLSLEVSEMWKKWRSGYVPCLSGKYMWPLRARIWREMHPALWVDGYRWMCFETYFP